MALSTFRVKVGDNWYTVEVGDLSRSPVEVTVEGETFFVEIEGLPPPPPSRPRGRRSQARRPDFSGRACANGPAPGVRASQYSEAIHEANPSRAALRRSVGACRNGGLREWGLARVGLPRDGCDGG